MDTTLTTMSLQITSKNSVMQKEPHTIQQPAGLSGAMTIGWSLVGISGMSGVNSIKCLTILKQGSNIFINVLSSVIRWEKVGWSGRDETHISSIVKRIMTTLCGKYLHFLNP